MTVTIVFVCIGIAVVAVAAAVAANDDRRMKRAASAGQAAAEAWRQRAANPPPPPGLDIHVNDWSERYGDERWRWTVWRSDARDAAADLVEGVLVPAAMGNAPTREDAERDAYAAIASWQQETGWSGDVRVLDDAQQAGPSF